MATLEITIPDALFEEFSVYADAAGLSIEAMIQEAATHSVRNDRLGVEQARLQRLLRETREIELLARQGKAVTPSTAASSENRAKPVDASADKTAATKSNTKPAKSPSMPIPVPDDALEDAPVSNSFFEETSNMATLELLTPRDL